MTLRIPCGRLECDHPGIIVRKRCREEKPCDWCIAIRQLLATCSGVADRLESVSLYPKGVIYDAVNDSIGRLRADVARVEGRTE